MNNSKNRILTTSALIMLAAIMAISITFAVITQSVVRKYQATITATNVLFKFNEKTFYDAIGSSDIDIYKGEAKDITLSVSAIGSNRYVVSYTVDFEFTETSTIAEAIEVYHYDGNHYDYLCMLDQLGSQTISGVMSTMFDEDILLRLVYPATASDYYTNDEVDKDFVIKASANASIVTSSGDYIFASDASEFKGLFENLNTVGKTIVLLDDMEITDTDGLLSQGKVGIDVNGHTLKIETNLTVDCKDNAQKSLGIINSGLNGGITSTTGKYITVLNSKNCYLVDNKFNCGQSSGIVRISAANNDFSAMFADYLSIVSFRTEKLTDGSLYYYGKHVSFLFDDINFYSNIYGLTVPGDSVIERILDVSGNDDEYKIVADKQLTDKYLFAFIFNYNSTAKSITGYVTVRGNSPIAIANALVDGLQSKIQSSQYFKTYDSVTGSHIEWHVDDGLGGDLLDSNGRYKKNGMEAIADRLENFGDRKVVLYLKITKGAETGSKAGDIDDTGDFGDAYLRYNLNVETANAADLTTLIFDNIPAVIFAGEMYDIQKTAIISTYRQKADLQGINIEIVEGTDIMGYLEVGESEDGEEFDIIKIKKDVIIGQNTLHYVQLSITFVYGSGENQKTYNIKKEITISGEVAEITKYDMSYRLQSAFIGNDYTEGKSFFFYAYGALMPQTKGFNVAVLVDYTPLGEAADYISVTYEFIPVDYEDLEDQIAYFVYENGKYVLSTTEDSSLEYYERKANIEVLPSKIRTGDQVTAYLKATLYTLDENGNPDRNEHGELVYIDPMTDRLIVLSYTVSLSVEGVIRNTESQIADANLYFVYRELFDTSGDGVITAREADNWDSAVTRGLARGLMVEYNSVYSGKVYYINLKGKAISSLKGVEYFPKTQGFDLTDTGRVDITILAQLNNLVYLNLGTTSSRINAVTNLAPLAYLDRLEYLNLNYNKVSNLEPLRHLPRLVHLYVNYNNIYDFEPLTEITTLKTLSFTGMLTVYNQSFTTDEATMYDFSIIQINNKNVSFIYGSSINITPHMEIGAKVMRDLEEINRVRHVLYLPTFYYYLEADGVTVTRYRLLWYTEVTEKNLTLEYDGYGDISEINYDDDGFVSYSIVNPIYDKKVTLYLKVYTNNDNVSNETFKFCREFTLTLETLVSTGLYIYDTGSGRYVDAMDVVPDDSLRSLIFEYFNADTSSSAIRIQLADGSYVDTTEKFVISVDDFTYINQNKLTIYNWNYQGIKNLEGIGYLKSIFTSTVSLNLTGNKFEPKLDEDGEEIVGALAPLKELTSLHTLTVGGDYYNFDQLVGLSSLRRLYVYESYDLDSEDALASLYKLYTSNASLNIYLTEGSTVAWNPYTTILPKKIQNLPTTATFQKLGDTFDLYEGRNGILINLYGVNYYFLVQSTSTIYTKHSAYTLGTTTSYIRITYGTFPSGTITYNSMFASSESAYVSLNLQSSSTDGHSLITYSGYFFQMIFDDPGNLIKVHSLPDDSSFDSMFIGDFIASRDLKAAALTRVFTYMLTTYPTARKATSEEQLLSSPAYYSYFYYDSASGVYHITTNMFTTAGAMTASTGSFSYSSSGSTLSNYGTYDTSRSSLTGLRYFTNITLLHFYQDANLGDGSELINIKSLYLYNSSVDLTTITKPLENLTLLSISGFYTFNVGSGETSALQYMPNLATLSLTVVRDSTTIHTTTSIISMYYIDDLSFLLALINGGQTKLVTLTVYGVASSVNISSKNAGHVRKVYEAARANGLSPAYQIGSPQSSTTSGYFRIIDDTMWFCTNNTDATKSLSWEEAGETSEFSVTDANNYSYVINNMREMGLEVNGTPWWSNKVFTLNIGDELTLPFSTGTNYYGLLYGADSEMTRNFDIEWTVYLVDTDGKTAITIYNKDNSGGDEVTIETDQDGYLVVIGTLTGTPSSARSFMYHFVVGNGDGFYSKVVDLTLRAWMFSVGHGNTVITNTLSINPSTTITNSAILTNMGLTALSNDSTSNYIYDLTGISDAVEQWAINREWATGAEEITSITITSQRMTDISPLFEFENLETLNLSGYSNSASYYSYVKLTGIEGELLNLKTLNLNNCIGITPDDIALLRTDAATRKLTSISLCYTNCMYTRETIEYLNEMLQSSGVATLNLALNYSTGTSAITKKSFEDFLKDTNPSVSYPDGVNAGMSIFINGTETRTIDKIQYTFVMTDYVNRMLKGHNVHNEVPIKLRVSSTSISQFNNTFIETKYVRSGVSSPMLFGADGETIHNFDTELIAYLLCYSASTSYMTTNANGYYIITAANRPISSTTSYSYGIKSFKNIDKLANGSYKVTYSAGIDYYWSLAYKEVANNFSLGGTTSIPAINQTLSYSYWNQLVHRLVASTYKYTINSVAGTVNQAPYIATLPSHVYYLGDLCVINWSIYTVSNLVMPNGTGGTMAITTTNQKILTYNADTGWKYELSEATVAVADGYSTGSLGLTYTITYANKTGSVLNTTSTRYTVTVTKYDDSSSPQLGFNFYVQVSKLGNKAVLYNYSNQVYYSLDIEPSVLYLSGGKYYSQYVVGASDIFVVSADEIFNSGRLIQYLYAKYFSSNIVYDTDASYGLQDGYLMTTGQILALTTLEIQYSTPTSVDNYRYTQYITSIEGIQIFCYISTFSAKNGAFTSIEPLSTLRLTSFSYGNSHYYTTTALNYGNDYLINDFTPLLEGSKDSLIKFSYNELGGVQMTDMNFLLSFTNPNLEVYLGSAYYSSTYMLSSSYANGLSYFATSSGKYLIYALESKGIPIYVSSTIADRFKLGYDTSRPKTISWYYTLTVYPLTVSVEYRLAFEMLDDYTTVNETNNIYENTYAKFLDGYLVNVETGGYEIDTQNYSINFDLNTLIYSNRGYYFIDWIAAKGDTTINGYYLENDLTFMLNGESVTYTAGTMLTKAQAKNVAKSVEYYSAYKSSLNSLKVSISVKISYTDYITDVFTRLVCKMENDMGHNYERMISVVFDNVSYL